MMSTGITVSPLFKMAPVRTVGNTDQLILNYHGEAAVEDGGDVDNRKH
jgi:hypothetical protein